jgi:NAD(P)-dependent dehydrogenase (short-subunit alcohol dehydrogenase family)
VRVLIVGGTRGIGLGLAIKYLENGCDVVVCSRHPERLDDDPVARHPRLMRRTLDVGNPAATGKLIDELAVGGIDLVVVSAGYYADAAAIKADPQEAERIVDTNVRGLCHVFDAVIPVMRQQRRGRLVVVASIAGLLAPYRNASMYSLSKRAAISLCAVYRKALAADGIGVTTIIPGYVDTPRLRELNSGSSRGKPFLMSQGAAVELIAAAIERGEEEFVFPRALHWLVKLFNLLPASLRSFRKK